jgi:hydroxymethylglutaryl-CoA synthase
MLVKHNLDVADFDFVIMHQPNADAPLRLARKLGFTDSQIESGLVFAKTGNAFTATVFLGLEAVLNQAVSGAKILLLSYGSGSGSEAVYLLKK